MKLSKLPELLDGEQKKAKSLTERNRENTMLLQRQTHAYLSVSPEELSLDGHEMISLDCLYNIIKCLL